MQFRENIYVYSEKYMEHINAICKQNHVAHATAIWI
jgi:hypothetical protein